MAGDCICGEQASWQPSDLSQHKRNTFTCLLFRFACCGFNKSNIWTRCWLQFSIFTWFFVCTYFALRKHFNSVLMSFAGKYTEWIVCTAPTCRPQFGTPFDHRQSGKLIYICCFFFWWAGRFLLLHHLISCWHHIWLALYLLATPHSFGHWCIEA